jgi:hypothetical protein
LERFGSGLRIVAYQIGVGSAFDHDQTAPAIWIGTRQTRVRNDGEFIVIEAAHDPIIVASSE